jgi:superfamily I DNA/RNA helicase
MSFFWEDALKPAAAAEGFCLLTLAVTPYDRAAYRAWLGLGDANGNVAGYKRVRSHAEANNLEPYDVGELISTNALQLPHTARIVERHNMLKARLVAIGGLNGVALVNSLWDAANPETLTIRLAAATLALEVPEAGDLHPRIVEVLTQPELPPSGGDIIRIMSLHKSKGLTAELVVVAGCVAGAIPSVDTTLPQSDQDADLKEQRRLFYVAITRAKETLVLSSVTQLPLSVALRANISPVGVFRRQGETYARLTASPFIAELGPSAPQAIRGSDWRAALAF